MVTLYIKVLKHLLIGNKTLIICLLKAHYATFLAKITLSMQVESYADGSASISGSISGCVIYPCRLSSEKAHNMQHDLFGPSQSGCDAAEVSSKM
jgi:hypothetical protein